MFINLKNFRNYVHLKNIKYVKLRLIFLRPKIFANDTVPMFDVIKHIVSIYNKQKNIYDKFCLIYATAVFIESKEF